MRILPSIRGVKVYGKCGKIHIMHDDNKNCLLNRKEQMRKMNVIRSHLHDVHTEEVNKVALSADDDKRVIMEDGIHTLAYGHYSLKLRGFIGFFDISVSLFLKESFH